ncbi:MAG: glycosyltransferase family 4 protein [Actinomycetota bacterium]|nr:glycosyltransferase family 4 protein [Actinomycetota bacterium]
MFTPSPHEQGGANKRVMLLAEGLAARGWQVWIVGRAGARHHLSVRRLPALVIVDVPGFGSRWLGAVLYAIVGVPVGVYCGWRRSVYLSIQLSSTSSVAGLCAMVWRRPFLASTSTSGQFGEAKHLQSGRLSVLRRALLRQASAIIAQTDEAAVEIERVMRGVEVKVVPNPVRPVAPAPLNGQKRVLFCGRLASEKNLFRLLDAWRIVASGSEARLILAGKGGSFRSVERELHARVASDEILRATVSLPGWLPDMETVYGTADVFVLPSTTEGMSNALLEACALRRVIVASDIPANRRVLGSEYPLLFPVEDVNALARLLRAALDDERVRAEALRQVTERVRLFSLDAVLDSIESMLLYDGEKRPDHD